MLPRWVLLLVHKEAMGQDPSKASDKRRRMDWLREMLLSQELGERRIRLSYKCKDCGACHYEYGLWIDVTERSQLVYSLKKRTSDGWAYVADMTLAAKTDTSFKFKSSLEGKRLTIRFTSHEDQISIRWHRDGFLCNYYHVHSNEIKSRPINWPLDTRKSVGNNVLQTVQFWFSKKSQKLSSAFLSVLLAIKMIYKNSKWLNSSRKS